MARERPTGTPGNIEASAVLLLEPGAPIRAVCVESDALAYFGGFSLGAMALESPHALRVIDAFRDATTLDQGYERYRRRHSSGSVPALALLDGQQSPLAIVVMNGACVASPPELLGRVLRALSPRSTRRDDPPGAVALDTNDTRARDDPPGVVALDTNDARGRGFPPGVVALDSNDAGGAARTGLLSAIAARHRPNRSDDRDLSKDAFADLVRELFRHGLLGRPVGQIDLGDVRPAPFDLIFGFARGTPIDRYYLDRFIEAIRPEVRGVVLEIGGHRANRLAYGFHAATEYRAMDLQLSDGVDVAGDAHDRGAIEPGSIDAILIFNVLEHCARPWVVADNLHAWLRTGGKVFAMVPSVQRVHRSPKDYWRPYPDGLEALFSSFANRRLFVYGNPLTSVAALLGIAAEELSAEELDRAHTGYPVATCLVAQK